MIYLSGAVRPNMIGKRQDLGFILTPQMGNGPITVGPWGADNGCFSHPERFDADKYLAWIQARPAATCLFATAPDVVGDARATLLRSLPFLPKLRALGVPAALCAQDGLEDLEIPWEAFDVLFIGGSTEWKLSAAAAGIVAEAKARGKWVHMGRVNSYRRLRYAQAIGCDSADGTFLAFGPDANLPKLEGWLDRLAQEPLLTPAPAPRHFIDARRQSGLLETLAGRFIQYPVICADDVVDQEVGPPALGVTWLVAQTTCRDCLSRLAAAEAS